MSSTWGELQDLANQAAHTLAARGVTRGDRVAVVLPPTPEAAAIFFGVWKLGAILLSMSVLYGDDGIEHRLSDSGAKLLVTDPGNAPRFDRPWAPDTLVLAPDTLAAAPTDFVCVDTAADDPAQLYYTSGTTGLAKGIVHAHRYILGHEEFRYCHELQDGERFHGMGEWAWAAGIAPLLGPWRLGALQCVYQREGGFDPHKQLDFLSRHAVTNVFTTPTAMRSMMAVEDAGTRYPQVFRRVCSAGEPLNPEAIRWFREQYGVTVLDYYGLTESYPLVANYPFLEVREGSMGRPMPGWDVQLLDEDEQPVGQGERGEICLRARTNPHYPLGYWRNDEASMETFGGEWFHTKDAAVQDEDGYVWYVGRADDVIIAAGYRIGPFEVESACLEHLRCSRGGSRRVARRAPGQRGEGVHRPRRRIRAVADARRRDQEPRPRTTLSVRIPTPRRVRARAAEDAHGKDSPHRAPRTRARPRGFKHGLLTLLRHGLISPPLGVVDESLWRYVNYSRGGSCCTAQRLPSGSPKKTNRAPREFLHVAHVDSPAASAAWAARMSETTICIPWTEPAGASVTPFPIAIEHADPGGVSWTKRMPSPTSMSTSATNPAWST